MHQPAGIGEPRDATQSRLLALFSAHRLSPAQRLVARYIVEHPHEAPFLSSVDLATRAGVSQPSVTRLAAAMGFPGFADLQRALRQVVVAAATQPDGGRNKYQEAVAAELRNVQAPIDAFADLDLLRDCAGRLAASRPLPVFGLRISAPLATHFGYFAAKLHPDVWILTDGGSTATDRLAQARLSGADALLAIVLPRYPKETFHALEFAHNLGYHTIAVTDRRSTRLDDLAYTVIPAAVGTGLLFDLHLAPLMVLTALLDLIAEAEPARTKQRLEDFERVAEHQQFFTGA